MPRILRKIKPYAKNKANTSFEIFSKEASSIFEMPEDQNHPGDQKSEDLLQAYSTVIDTLLTRGNGNLKQPLFIRRQAWYRMGQASRIGKELKEWPESTDARIEAPKYKLPPKTRQEWKNTKPWQLGNHIPGHYKTTWFSAALITGNLHNVKG